ncbi:MAG: GNAT family N-acetyltransferase [Rhodospirillaceae bacterium]|jgi:GNAT superfamily N-acetyltransferase|nr:GNAT family N-acetyltransferase [Rhodospirillaceae bacterium]MBT6511370.1 GNAT family N-acetyltransferase [Rhodospirillaceae bacterium]
MTEVFDKDDPRKLETVISFLEMRRPPARPARPVPLRKLAIMRAEKPPVGFYLYLYRSVGAAWNWTDRLMMPAKELEAIIHDDDVEVMVLHVAGVPAGYAELDFRNAGDGQSELGLFGLSPDFIGQRLGGYFLDWAIGALWRPGIERVVVNTNTLDHPRALALYQKAGFEIVGRETSWLVPEDSVERPAES